MAAVIDLNADLGESLGQWQMGDDEAMLDVVTSANVACGFHAGDPVTTRQTCAAAAAKGVRIGAHPSYRDLVGFGRNFMDIAAEELEADVLYQLGALQAFAKAAGTKIAYVKPHGALYNAIVSNEAQARAVVNAVKTFDAELPIMCLPGAAVLKIAEGEGLRPIAEAFCDRGYNPDGTLVSRRLPGAVLHDAEEVAQRMLWLVTQGTVVAANGAEIELQADSLCTHGDSPGAVEMAKAVRQTLLENGVQLKAFA